VDDLVTRGVTEPYRMFTSRAEYRLSLREDNADWRLTELGWKLGLVDEQRWDAFNRKRDAVEHEVQRLRSTWVHPGVIQAHEATRIIGKPLEKEYTLADLLKRPQVTYQALMTMRGADQELIGQGLPAGVQAEQVETQIKYEGYISRQMDEIERSKHQEQIKIPVNIDYDALTSLSFEARQKLKQHRPESIGAASRISGITPAAISTLLVFLKKKAGRADIQSAA